MKHSFLALTAFTGLLAVCVACTNELPKEAYYTHGQPESLLETSEKTVKFDLSEKHSMEKVTHWVGMAHPKQATLQCKETSKTCNKLERWLVKQGVSVTRMTARNDKAVFETVSIRARDCEGRYIDNMINPYNLNHSTFGCSLAANSVQMVTDRREFVDPPLQGAKDGRKAAQIIDKYNTPPNASTEFSPLVSSGGGGGSSGR